MPPVTLPPVMSPLTVSPPDTVTSPVIVVPPLTLMAGAVISTEPLETTSIFCSVLNLTKSPVTKLPTTTSPPFKFFRCLH